MFKSLFTKYFIAFILIVVISFALLATIFTVTINEYSDRRKQRIVDLTVETVKSYVEDKYETTITDSFNQFVYFNKRDIRQILQIVSGYSDDMTIIICDIDGYILITDQLNDGSYIVSTIPADFLEQILTGEQASYTGTLDGLFQENQSVQASAIVSWQKGNIGAVLVCSAARGMDDLIDVFIRTIIMSCLWVLFAALISVYFISENIIKPLKNMSNAAKNFASGDFSVRVPVIGNDEVANLATAFNNMANSLENLENIRSTFLANISHDLRTPMTTINGFIDGIIDGKIPLEKHEYYLNVIRTEVRRLSRLVASLLDISRLEAGERKLAMSDFDICEMARQIIISFEQKISDKNLDVEFYSDDDNMLVNADRDAIYQIFYNICDNGVKFSHEGGKYKISIIKKNKKAYVSVYNEGQGILADELPFVFDRFYKSDKSRGLDKTGVGLGLYIAKTIIDSHKEEIWVRSEYGRFCEFVFTLKLS